MKRDMDLVRTILLAIEGGKVQFVHGNSLDGSDATPEAVTYHLNLLEQAGLVDVRAKVVGGMTHVRGLTWGGHEFVDTVRDSTVWRKTKEGAAHLGGAGLAILIEVGKAVGKAELQRLGILPGG
jgi:DNA-binding transcriptional ArsR family regulator